MILGPKKINRDGINIQAGDCVVKPSEKESLLGCQIHQSLKWNNHIVDSSSSMVRQLNQRNNALKRVCINANFQTRLILANGIIHSKLVYLINVWGGAQTYLIKMLQVQQLVAARIVCGPQSLRWSRSKTLKTIGWLSVKQLIVFYAALQAHKTVVSGNPRFLFTAFSSDYPYPTRSAANKNIRVKSNSTQTFEYRAAVAYNRVPADVKKGSLPTVKKS